LIFDYSSNTRPFQAIPSIGTPSHYYQEHMVEKIWQEKSHKA